ncbi:carbohydrate ABC transporter permease [Microbacterium dauci]|uniref:Sugar ABC transporter permease n=1 Tax=Microbacterium dauci TaxID=3048008 RepID=A0ABT6ZE77_9MICO|nr:sugar ABC transporter permease [Microbacterium sp. LX3-4]MDJ1114471.1 sugar ABC transporter permease [Microbacterium sp. LX3-4]
MSLAFIVPAMAIYAIAVIYPTLAGGLYAFTDWRGGADAEFTGFANFAQLLADPRSSSALVNTLVIAAVCTVAQTVIGLALALALHSRLRSRNALRTLFFAPALLPAIIVGFLWQFLLTPNGPLNSILEGVGLGMLTQNWLGDTDTALGAVIIVILWQNVGITMVIYLAGLEGIPAEVHEAAQIDGAGVARRVISVTVPLLGTATTISVALTLISSLKIFDQVFAMTYGGPGFATETLTTIMYKEAFVSGRFGYGAAIALVLTMIVVGLAMLQMWGSRRLEVRQ